MPLLLLRCCHYDARRADTDITDTWFFHATYDIFHCRRLRHDFRHIGIFYDYWLAIHIDTPAAIHIAFLHVSLLITDYAISTMSLIDT